MEAQTPTVTLYKILKMFEKIYTHLDKSRLPRLEEELVKLVPTEKSEIFIGTDMMEEPNSFGMNITISNPLPSNSVSKIEFDKLMFEWLLRTDVNQLIPMYECIRDMEKKGINEYSIDFIPVFYDDDEDDYYFQFRIIKKHKNYGKTKRA